MQHHLEAERRAVALELGAQPVEAAARDHAERATHVGEVDGVEQRLGELGHRPVAPAQEQTHVGATEDERLHRARPEHEIHVGGERQQLQDVLRVERRVGLAHAHKVGAGRLHEAASDRRAIALRRLEHLACHRRRHCRRRVGVRVVVDHDDVVDDAQLVEGVDAVGDAARLVVGGQHDCQRLSMPHGGAFLALQILAAGGRYRIMPPRSS